MRIKQYVGAVGGRPNLAYYFVGVQYPLGYDEKYTQLLEQQNSVEAKSQ